MERDKYDKAIDWLCENAGTAAKSHYQSVVEYAWDEPEHEAHCLFQHASVTGEWEDYFTHRGCYCGCLTQIRSSSRQYVGATPAITAAIRDDKQIPCDINELKDLRDEELRAALQPFAEWQRRLDREIRT